MFATPVYKADFTCFFGVLMKLNRFAATIALVAVIFAGVSALYSTSPAANKNGTLSDQATTASGVKINPSKHRVATYQMWCYDVGASAVRGKTGVVDTTRLLRSSPFGEWVNVFYDPAKTDEAKLLQLIKERDCPRAKRTTGKTQSVLNPIIAPGEPIQIKFELKQDSGLSRKTELPKKWELVGNADFRKGANVITIQTPKSIPQGTKEFELEFDSGEKVRAVVDVVQQVGKH